MSESSRRDFLKIHIVGAAAASLVFPGAASGASDPEIFFQPIAPRDYSPNTDKGHQAKIAAATLDFIEDNWSSRDMPLWEKPLGEVDIEWRVRNMLHWICEGVDKYKSIFPVDPVLGIALIMQESFFKEDAISHALAVGSCQFTNPTAGDYGMVCAGSSKWEAPSGTKEPDLASKVKEYYALAREISYHIESKPDNLLGHEEALEAVVNGSGPARDAKASLDYLAKLRKLRERRQQAGRDYAEFLRMNAADKDIKSGPDARWLQKLDNRLAYKFPVPAMVLYLARGLDKTNGNVLATVGGYNAGMGRTKDVGAYEYHGRIPGNSESTLHASRILTNYKAITRRILAL